MAIRQEKQLGMSLVGLLIAMAIITTSLIYLLGVVNFSFLVVAEKEDFYRAGFLAQEAMEASRSFRDATDWSVDGLGAINLSSPGLFFPYHFVQQGPPLQWIIIPGEETIDGFTRRAYFYEVRRDAAGSIMESGGGVDINTKRIEVVVSWQGRAGEEVVSLQSYFTNWQ